MASVIIVGSCMIDLVSYTSRFPKPGETIFGNSFSIGFGGKGANQCVAAAKLGVSSAIVAKVGDDSFGHDYCKNFDDNNVDRQHVKFEKNVSTGAATIIVDEKGENSIIIVAGANLHLTNHDVLLAEDSIKNSKVLVCQREIDDAATKEALKLGNKYGVITLMNAAPASATMDEDIFSLSSIFCVNETEAEILTGVKVSSVDDAKKAAKEIIQKGSSKVIITMGAQGAIFSTAVSFKHIQSPVVEDVIDTTGAGDSFIGALAYYLSSFPELPMEKMIEESCKIASFSVRRKGTQTSFPTWDQMKS